MLNQEQTNSGFLRKVPTSVTNNGWTQIFHEIYAITQLCMSSSHFFTNSVTLNLQKNHEILSVYISTGYNFFQAMEEATNVTVYFNKKMTFK